MLESMKTLYDWQSAELDTFVREGGVGLLAWGMGSGKTVTAVEAAKRLRPAQTLIIAPQSTHVRAWIKTWRGQEAPGEIRIAGNKNKATKQALFDLEMGEPGAYLVTPQFMTRTDVSLWAPDLIIADEVHQYTGSKSKGLKNLLKIESKHRAALSGTPARNKVANLWGVNRFLWPDRAYESDIADPDFFRWASYRLVKTQVYTNQRDKFGNPKKAIQWEGELYPGKIFSEMPFVSVHHARERCCDAHPNGVLGSLEEPAVMEEVIDLLPAQKKAIREMEDMMVTYLEENPMVADIPLTAAQRIRQCVLGVPTVEWSEDEDGEVHQSVSYENDCKSPYLDRLIEILETDDETFVVWTDSAKFARVAANRIHQAGIKVDMYTGARKADLEKFGAEDGFRVLVAVPSSASTGTDGLQDVCRSEVWLSRDMDNTITSQGYGRLFRTGQTQQVRRWIFHDDLGISEGQYSEALAKQLELNKSLRTAGQV